MVLSSSRKFFSSRLFLVLLSKAKACEWKRKICVSYFFVCWRMFFCSLLNFLLLRELWEIFAILLSRFCCIQCIMSSKMTLGEMCFSVIIFVNLLHFFSSAFLFFCGDLANNTGPFRFRANPIWARGTKFRPSRVEDKTGVALCNFLQAISRAWKCEVCFRCCLFWFATNCVVYLASEGTACYIRRKKKKLFCNIHGCADWRLVAQLL